MSPAPSIARVQLTPARWLGMVAGDISDLDLVLEWMVSPLAPAPAVLAFDVGKTIGWARFDATPPGPFKSYQVGEHRLNGGVSHAFTGMLLERITDLCQRNPASPKLVVVEDVFMGKNAATQAHLAYYVGAVLYAAASRGLPAIRVAPSTWQSKMIGKVRRAQGKKLSLLRARATFPYPITSDHMADAALMGLFMRGGR